ncbi:hypothetical protein [uncultured Psychroserpens sp.]|uniref:hypothetical protein n=1 Tax=uncultured Psychroserpens sp. TaxID=255436 RepID=UPI0026199DAC|nr:hypothetical protein [uncultured Psychroserpens sp.]
MKSRWYISTLIITLALLGGIANQQQSTLPNQQIVLQFTTGQITLDEAQHAIAEVKQQLKLVGVDDVEVDEYLDGQLIIRYYSDTDVASIKKILSNQIALGLSDLSNQNTDIPDDFPSEEKSIAYNVDVYEIQNEQGSTSDIAGKLGLEQKAENNRFSNPNQYFTNKDAIVEDLNALEQGVGKFRKRIEITIDNNSYKIPEVRAGPNSNSNGKLLS